MKTLSIIIPIYNTPGKYFSKCLASLQCQEMDELEVIAVDDGSFTIHHFAGSWLPADERAYGELYKRYYTAYVQAGVPGKIAYYFCRLRAAYEVGGGLYLLKRVLHLKR